MHALTGDNQDCTHEIPCYYTTKGWKMHAQET